jgi:hypothetical protein
MWTELAPKQSWFKPMGLLSLGIPYGKDVSEKKKPQTNGIGSINHSGQQRDN